jgi:hypothetical protein
MSFEGLFIITYAVQCTEPVIEIDVDNHDLLARGISPAVLPCGLEFITYFPTFSLTLSAAFFPDSFSLLSQESWQICRRTTEGFCKPQRIISMVA